MKVGLLRKAHQFLLNNIKIKQYYTMPNIPDRFHFEPDNDALSLWLYTRKTEKHHGMINSPGFFSTQAGSDQFFFIMALILELVGMSLLIINGLKLGDSQFAIIAIVGALGLFIADLFFAYKLHRNHGHKTFYKNVQRITEKDIDIARIQEALKRGKIGNVFLILGIILIAIVKFFGITLLGTFDHLAIKLSLFIMFSFIVYAHVNHTGYFLYEWLTKRKFKKQHQLWSSSVGKNDRLEAKERVHRFDSDIKLDIESEEEGISANGHKIVSVNAQEKKGKYAYKLITKGILIDEDIPVFLNGMNREQKSLVITECLRHQVYNIQNNAPN